MRLSLCMIVKNEAANLPRCLESVQGIVDEIVVLDTGSTDHTPDLARSYGAKVHHFAWCNDFSAARNKALKFVSGNWVLVLDADERFVPSVVPLLKRAMQQPTALVINLVRQEIGATQSPYSLVSRLFRRHPDLYFARPYHAMVDDSVAVLLQQEPQWQIIDCPEVAILHEGYAPDAIAGRNKLETARVTMEGFLADHPADPYVCSKLGALYVELGNFSRGVALLERGLTAEAIDAPVRYELHYHLGIAYSRLQDWQQAEQHYRTAIQQPLLERLRLAAYHNLGSLLKNQGNFLDAQHAYQTCLRIDPQFAMGHCNLGSTLKAMGQLAGAIQHFQIAIQIDPAYADAHQNLGVALLKLGRVTESLAAFRQAIALHEQQNSPEASRLRQSLTDMGFSV
jgi:glycosyltransferase involved in cell wall biosynthesis